MIQRKNAGGEEERRGEGWRGGKPAMQHSLNYSSTSEWVASDRKMERSTKREVEREEGKGGRDEWGRKRGDRKGRKKQEGDEEKRGRGKGREDG